MRVLVGALSLVSHGGVQNQFILLCEALAARGYDVACFLGDPMPREGNQYYRKLRELDIPVYEYSLQQMNQRQRIANRVASLLYQMVRPFWLIYALMTQTGSLRSRWQATERSRSAFFKGWRNRLQPSAAGWRQQALDRALLEFQPDVFHHVGQPRPDVVQYLKAYHCPTITWILGGKAYLTQRWESMIGESLPYLDVIALECETNAEVIRQHFGATNRIEVIPSLYRAIEVESQAPSAGVRVCYIARLYPDKGTAEARAAMSQILKQTGHVYFDVVGDGDDLVDFQRDFAGENRVVLHGVLSSEETLQVLAKADIYMLPSYTEGLPSSMIEAMSLGKPVIVTPVGCIPEMLDGNGLLIPVKDTQALADAILTLVQDDDLRRRMGQRSRELCEQRHITQVVIDHFEQLYAELMP